MEELILRSLSGSTTDLEETELSAWRRAAPENEQHYRDIVTISRLAADLDSGRVPDTPPPASALIERAERLTASALDAEHGRRPRRRGRRALAAAAAIVVIGLGGFLYVGYRGGPGVGTDLSHQVVAGPSETMSVALDDGSVVRLAPGGRLRFDPQRTREVALEGRAYFVVAGSPDRPFRVRTRDGEATVLGTRFELATGDDGLDLLVVEGHVALGAGGGTQVDVRGGQTSRIVEGTISTPEPVADPVARLDWLGRFLVFQATPLPEVARELERVYGVRVRVADASLAGQSVTGWYSDKPFEDVFDILCTVLDARCSLTEDMATFDVH